jgi:hypothetical protein
MKAEMKVKGKAGQGNTFWDAYQRIVGKVCAVKIEREESAYMSALPICYFFYQLSDDKSDQRIFCLSQST